MTLVLETNNLLFIESQSLLYIKLILYLKTQKIKTHINLINTSFSLLDGFFEFADFDSILHQPTNQHVESKSSSGFYRCSQTKEHVVRTHERESPH